MSFSRQQMHLPWLKFTYMTSEPASAFEDAVKVLFVTLTFRFWDCSPGRFARSSVLWCDVPNRKQQRCPNCGAFRVFNFSSSSLSPKSTALELFCVSEKFKVKEFAISWQTPWTYITTHSGPGTGCLREKKSPKKFKVAMSKGAFVHFLFAIACRGHHKSCLAAFFDENIRTHACPAAG